MWFSARVYGWLSVLAFALAMSSAFYWVWNRNSQYSRWNQTSCINNSVMEWRHSYWHDLGHYCVTSEDLTNMAERNKRKQERRINK